MTEQYTPPESAIAAVLKKTGSDPRKLAIAYLRSQHRVQEQVERAKMQQSVQDWADAMAAVLGQGGRRT